ncbi:MAG: aldehyde dehydrogenase family protein, partial [Elusimicrobiota bacterium]
LSLELGGKSPCIVFEDAPLYEAGEGGMDSIFFNQGQVCCAGSRLFVQESIAPKFITLLKERAAKIRVGDPMDKNNDMGAINSKAQLEKIRRYAAVGQKEGAKMWQADLTCPAQGFYFPPTIFTDVEPSHTIAQEEIFGPVLSVLTFRTPDEAVELANNTPYGLAASVWTKDVSKMIEVSRKLRAGTVWGNSANKFDAAAEFGGFKESGFGREGGPLGLREYLKAEIRPTDQPAPLPRMQKTRLTEMLSVQTVWKTPKMLVGGKQVRSESGRYYKVFDHTGKKLLANVNLGSKKDVRDAVEAALKAQEGWGKATAYNRGQILYRLAEMLESRAAEFAAKIVLQTGVKPETAATEVRVAVERTLYYAGWADKYTGNVNPVTQKDFNITYPEPVGVSALIAPDAWPLLGLINKIAPAMAAGAACIIVASEKYPLTATDLIEVIETSDVPGGAVNILTGKHDELAPAMASHRAIAMMDYTGTPQMGKQIEELSVSNLKRTYLETDKEPDQLSLIAQGRARLERYLEFKTVWITSGY